MTAERTLSGTAIKTIAICIAFICALLNVGCSSGGNTSTSSAAEESQSSAQASSSEEQSANAISSSKSEASDQAAAESEESSKAVKAKLNKAIETDEYDIVFTESYWDAADSDGSWVYSQGDHVTRSMKLAANAQVFVVRASITNKATSAIRPALNCRGTALANDKYEYEVKATSESGTSDIAPLETANVLLYVELPQAMKDQFKNIDVQWGFTVDDTYPQTLDDLYEVYDLYFK